MRSDLSRPTLDQPIVFDFGASSELRPGRPVDGPGLDALYAHPAPGAGWVRTNFVSTVDGSAVGDDGRSGSINTASDRQLFATLRAHADVVLVGAGTVRAEGYRAIELEPWQVALRENLGLAPFPTLAVVTNSLDVDASVAPTDPDRQGAVVILTSADSDPARREALTSAGVEVVTFGPGSVDLGAAVAHLADRGRPRILCEGGAGLLHRLLEAGLIDDLCLTLSARLVGGAGDRIVTGAALRPNVELTLAHLLHCDDGALFTRYLVRR